MPSYPSITVAGVQMNDPSGRWELLPGTSILPTFPGRRVTNYAVPGQAGNRTAAYAPAEAAVTSLTLRFNAVGTVANTMVAGTAAKAAAISKNIDLFYQTTSLARSGYNGLLEIRRYLSANDYRKASGRVVTASEPDWPPYADYATLTVIFEIPSGVWGSPDVDDTRATITGGLSSQYVKVPAGSAPSNANLVAIKGPYEYNKPGVTNGNRISVTNANGSGFRIGIPGGPRISVLSNEWLVVNTETWKCGVTPIMVDTSINWAGNKPYAGWLEPVARPAGSALPILPSTETGKGIVSFYLPASRGVAVRSRKTWY